MHVVRNIQKPLGRLYHPAKKINEFLGLLAFLVRHLPRTHVASCRRNRSTSWEFHRRPNAVDGIQR